MKEYTPIEINYHIEQRVQERIVSHGSIEKAIENCEFELKEDLDLWSKYSCDSLGHAITCNKLLLDRLKELC